MDDTYDPALAQRIDLTRQMDVAYWCRVFGVSTEQLREAVQHAGHEVHEVRRYLSRGGVPPG